MVFTSSGTDDDDALDMFASDIDSKAADASNRTEAPSASGLFELGFLRFPTVDTKKSGFVEHLIRLLVSTQKRRRKRPKHQKARK